ncbi:hypothetical protein B0T24DRAFT_577000 [Lasiosphaeria ovina]|uniref:Actin-like ATPase domain-containing protein n=1 Tax=Lasiosphaeria ovina TaxID=92902 RepID=A0AAE0N808_9PEZI|nr:hypothetical protein B0T24DRAFT_577000 [Lasiosphaeria ovina]
MADTQRDRQSGATADVLKIIIGVDYGTTFTGVSFVTSDKTNVDDIDVIRTWPGDGGPVEGNWKTPTVIAYGSENNNEGRNRWGYEVRRGMEACSWTKLLLDTSAETAEFDDPSLREATGSALFHLPPGKDAQMVCQDFLVEVYRFVVNNLRMRMTPEVFKRTPMECYLTIPAIWTDKARSATLEAAKAAGFGSRKIDSIYMIPEPEAAAIAALRKDLRPGSVNAVNAGDNLLVVDCGGGTVDITSYTVRKTLPTIEFDEICVGVGGKCGSTYIDRKFLQLMAVRFGKSFEKVPPKRRGPGSQFMASFERVKQSFGTSGRNAFEADRFDIHPIDMLGTFNTKQYDEDEATVFLTKQDMMDLFNPAVKEIVGLVSRQVRYASDIRGKKINLVVLVGGFGNSDYLKKALDKWCARNGKIKCIRPDFCQSAVVRGAAIRGLEGTTPTVLICRRHYGISYGRPFRSGIDDQKNAYFHWGEKHCKGWMKWIVSKGIELTTSTFEQSRLERTWSLRDSFAIGLELYSCTLDSPPERIEDPSVVQIGKVRMDFTNVDMSKFDKRPGPHGTEYRLKFKICMEFRSDEGVLKCFCLSQGQKIGVTTIDFTESSG